MSIDTQVRPPDSERKVFGITLPSRSGGGGAPVVVGAQPRANLLPPEIILKRKQLKTRRSLRFGVLLVAIAVAAGCVGSFGVAAAAQVQLGIVQTTQQDLLAQQSKFTEVRKLKETIAMVQAGQQVGASTEIDWSTYLTKLQATLPAGVLLTAVDIDEGTPMTAFGQSNNPLSGSQIASLAFTATSSTLPSIPDWLRSMAKLPGFVDATPGSVAYAEGTYTAQVVMHINTSAFSMRFDPATVAAAAAAAADEKAKATPTPTPAASDSATPNPTPSSTTDSEGN